MKADINNEKGHIMGKIFVAATAAGKLPSVAAAAVLLASGWVGTVQAETLASWTLNSNAKDDPEQTATSTDEGIFSASLSAGSGVTKNNTGNSFGGSSWHEGYPTATLATALDNGNYIEVSFTIETHYTVTPTELTFILKNRATNTPYRFQWVYLVNEDTLYTPLGNAEDIENALSSNTLFTLDLTPLGELTGGTTIKLRLAAWNAPKTGGTFNLMNSITLTGTSEREISDELTLDPIDNVTASCGEGPIVVRLGIFGDSGMGVTTNVTTAAAITGTTNLVDGVFTYVPTKADAALSPITFTAIVTKDGETPVSQSFDVTVNVIPPAIGEIEAQQCYAGDTNIMALTLSGDYAEAGEIVSTNAICQTYGITGQFSTNITDGVFWYAPSMGDIAIAEENEGVIGFLVVFTVGDLAATNEFTVAVSEKPDFLEGFEKIKTSTTYINTENTILEGDAASWRGTNYLVNGRSIDNFRGTRAVCFRDSGTAYIEMATSKANGAGTISFWHGRVPNDATQTTNLLDVFISNNGGSTWNRLTEDAIVVSNEFVKTTIEDVNVGGNVMLRFVKTYGSKRMYIDDIIITDYEGQAVIEPAIGEINNRTIHADESVEIQIEFYGDDWLTKSVECTTPGVASEEYGFDSVTGAFSFNPSLDDLSLNGGVIGFTVFLKNGDVVRASRSFTVTLLPSLPKWLDLRPNTFIRENFNSMGTDTDAELPAPWRVAHTNTLFCTNSLSYGAARQITEKRATNASGAISIGNAGIYNMGTNEQDRAVGFLSANGSPSQYRTCALMVPVKNAGSSAMESIHLRYKIEKWRKGHGKTLALCISTDGVSWTAVGDEWKTETSEDTKEENGQTKTDTTVLEMGADPLLNTISGKLTLPEPLAAGDIVYLGWFYMSNDNNCGSAQALAVDDVRISAGNPDMTVIIMK